MHKIIIAEDRRRIDTTIELSKYPIHQFYRPIKPRFEQTYHHRLRELNDIGEFGESVVRTVLGVEGVTSVFIQPYQLSVDISKAFDRDVVIQDVAILLGLLVDFPVNVEYKGTVIERLNQKLLIVSKNVKIGTDWFK